jgi:hypothetical protein
VFTIAAPIAAVALLVVLFLKEVPLKGPGERTNSERPGVPRAPAGDPERRAATAAR